MLRFIIAAILTGLLFGIMDGLIYANPLAVKLMECYRPISKKSINVPAGIVIDLVYGFAISGIFCMIQPVLPSANVLINGILFGTVLWFFRVLMDVISRWMMFTVPVKTLSYIALTGLAEMIIIGLINGLILAK